MVGTTTASERRSKWMLLSHSQIGHSHELRGTDNQDAIYCRHLQSGKSGLILAVSDGHGGQKYVRSRIGAKVAVKITAEYLKHRLGTARPSIGSSHRLSRTELEDEISTAILRNWQHQVSAHAKAHPWTAEEQDQGWHDGCEDIYTAYGATLLFVAAMPGILLYGQIGDGDILCVSHQGEVSRPIERSASSFANETHSLCSPDAAANFRLAISRYEVSFVESGYAPPSLVLVATDGYSNSFVDEQGFLQAAADIRNYLHTPNGYRRVERALPEWLKQCSKQGSGDDVTVGLIFPENIISTTSSDRKRDHHV